MESKDISLITGDEWIAKDYVFAKKIDFIYKWFGITIVDFGLTVNIKPGWPEPKLQYVFDRQINATVSDIKPFSLNISVENIATVQRFKQIIDGYSRSVRVPNDPKPGDTKTYFWSCRLKLDMEIEAIIPKPTGGTTKTKIDISRVIGRVGYTHYRSIDVNSSISKDTDILALDDDIIPQDIIELDRLISQHDRSSAYKWISSG